MQEIKENHNHTYIPSEISGILHKNKIVLSFNGQFWRNSISHSFQGES